MKLRYFAGLDHRGGGRSCLAFLRATADRLLGLRPGVAVLRAVEQTIDESPNPQLFSVAEQLAPRFRIVHDTRDSAQWAKSRRNDRPVVFMRADRERLDGAAGGVSRRGLRRRCSSLRARSKAYCRPTPSAGDFLDEPHRRRAASDDHAADRRAAGHDHRPVQAAGTDRRRRAWAWSTWPSRSEPVRRRVALKVIKPGMDTRQVIARFEAERQALALMDHPEHRQGADARDDRSGPALLRDGAGPRRPDHRVLRSSNACRRASGWSCSSGLPGGAARPSKGDHPPRPQADRTCWSRMHDGQPVPKVIDFGVAKATGQQLTEQTLFTGFAQMIGTPLYMSPEQAELNQPRHRHAQRHLFAGRAAVRAADRHDAVRKQTFRRRTPLRRNAADHPRGRAAQAEHAAQHARAPSGFDRRERQPEPTRQLPSGCCAATWTGS